jgi:hypothetical protein
VRRALVLLLLIGAVLPAFADDVTVTYISRLPEIDYVWGSANPTREGWPGEGQPIVWRGHVKNFSDRAVTTGYRWLLDGGEVGHGTVTLAPNATTTIDLPSAWSFDRHRLALDVDPVPGEESAANNRLEVFTDALSVGFYVEQSLYDYFRVHQPDLGIGSTCWENFAQRMIGFYNDMAANAVYPETPNGVLDRWRLQEIVIVPDDALPLTPPAQQQRGREPTVGSSHPNDADRSVDLIWGFRRSTIPAYGDRSTATIANPFYIPAILIHEIGHARYLTDVYGFNVLYQPPAFDNTIAGPALRSQTPEQGLMNDDMTFIDRYSAICLNRIAGARATRGNYNDPENIGSFLNDLPEENRVTIRDPAGVPIANADVEIFQSALGHYDEWYSTFYDDVPDLALKTDGDGRVLVGRCPFSGDGVVVNYWRGSNTVAIVRVKGMYGFLESRLFNYAWWRGDTRLADYDLYVGGSDCAPRGPGLISPAWDETLPSGPVHFSWGAIEGATEYRLVAAIDGAAPRVIATTKSSEVTVPLAGSIYWWIEADRPPCETPRSSTSHLVLPRVRRRAMQ